MFSKLISLASGKAYQLLLKRGASCPDCGKALNLPSQLPSAGFKSTIRCQHCDWMGSITSLSRSADDQHLASDVKPADTQIRETIGVQNATWLIPAKKGVNFLMFFAFIWLGMISVATVSMISGGVTVEGGGEASPWVAGLFLVPFWAIGLGVGYIGLRMAYTELLVRVDASSVILTRKFFKRMWDKSVPREHVSRVHLSVSHRQNETPVYQVEIENADGKNLKFGSSLSQDEKRWLVGGLQAFLKVQTDGEEKSTALGSADEIDSKTLKIEKIGNIGFRVTRIYRAGPWFMGIGFLITAGTLIGLAVLWNGYNGKDASGLDLFFDLLFSAVPFLMTLIGFFVGLGLLAGGYWSLGRKKIFEFGRDQLSLSTHWRGERKKERFDRDSFKSVTSSSSGQVNGDPRFKVVLVGEKQSLPICDYENLEGSQALEVWLQSWIDGS